MRPVVGGQQHSKAVTVETCGAQCHERLVSFRNQPRGLGQDTPRAQLIEGKHLCLIEKFSVEHLADAHINGAGNRTVPISPQMT